jgi:cobalt-zinc-cadmium resistance protein CzcA
MNIKATVILVCISAWTSYGQKTTISLNDAIRLAIDNHPSMIAAQLETARGSILERTVFDLPKTEVSMLYGQYNSFQKNDNNLTIAQTIPFPGWFAAQRDLTKASTKLASLNEDVIRNELTYQVRLVVNELLYLKSRDKLLEQQDSLLNDLVRIATVRLKTGEGTTLALYATETQQKELKNLKSRNEADMRISLDQLRQLCQSTSITGVDDNFEDLVLPYAADSLALRNNPALVFSEQQIEIARRNKKVERARAMPDMHIGYFNQTLIGVQNINGQDRYFGSGNRFQGFQVGISFPLWFAPHAARMKAAGMATEIAKKQAEVFRIDLMKQLDQAYKELAKNQNSLYYYVTSALTTANMFVAQSRTAFQHGEIGQGELLLAIKQSLTIREEYLITRRQYNASLFTINYLTGIK